MKKGTPVLVSTGGKFVHGYLYADTGAHVLVEFAKKKKEFHDRGRVFRNVRGYPRPLVPLLVKEYNARKTEENDRLVQDTLKYGFDVSSATLLTLDDFPRGVKARIPNTTKAWIAAGGIAKNVWVPNPDPLVVQAVQRAGGNGFVGTLLEFLSQKSTPTSSIDVAYLDFCGYLSTNKESIEMLFSKRLLATGRTLLHVTFSKREGKGIVEATEAFLSELCKVHSYGRCVLVDKYNTKTTAKGAFLVGTSV